MSNQKTPTTILLTPDRKFHSFGYAARDFYHDLDPSESKQWLYLEKFKMKLHTTAVRTQTVKKCFFKNHSKCMRCTRRLLLHPAACYCDDSCPLAKVKYCNAARSLCNGVGAHMLNNAACCWLQALSRFTG